MVYGRQGGRLLRAHYRFWQYALNPTEARGVPALFDVLEEDAGGERDDEEDQDPLRSVEEVLAQDVGAPVVGSILGEGSGLFPGLSLADHPWSAPRQ